MQFIALLVITITLTIEAQLQGQCNARQVHSLCAYAHGVDRTAISSYLNGAFARSQNERCFRACVLTQCNYFNPDGILRQDAATRLAPFLVGGNPSLVNTAFQLVRHCQSNSPLLPNSCDSIEAFLNCIFKNAPFTIAIRE